MAAAKSSKFKPAIDRLLFDDGDSATISLPDCSEVWFTCDLKILSDGMNPIPKDTESQQETNFRRLNRERRNKVKQLTYSVLRVDSPFFFSETVAFCLFEC